MSGNSMRVGQLIVSSSIGGAETVVLNLTRKLLESGVNTTVIINDELIKYFHNIENLNIVNIGRIYRHNIRNSYLRNIYIAAYFKAHKRRILKKILDQNLDVIHIHLSMSMALFNEVKKYLKVRSIYTIHDVVYVENGSRNVFDMIKTRTVTHRLSKSDYYTSACNYFISVFSKLGLIRDNYKIIPNGIDLNEFRDVKKIELDGDFKLLFLGGARYEKGGDILVQALEKVKKHVPNVKLYVLRDIPEDHFMKKYVRAHALDKNVVFVGYKRPPEYYSYILSSDVVILPSRTEGIAASLLEDMALGKPIVATQVGGTPELIRHDVNGILTDPSPDSLASSILHLYQNPQEIRKISDANLRDVKMYDWNLIVKQYIKTYEKILENGVPSRLSSGSRD